MNYEHEVVVPGKGMPFKIDRFEGDMGNYIRKPHWHNSIEIFAIYSGYLDFIYTDRTQRVETGDFIIINSNEVHSVKADKENDALYLQIPITEFKNYLNVDKYIFFEKDFKTENQDDCDKSNSDIRMLENMQRIYKLMGTDEDGHEYQMLSAYYEIMYDMVNVYRQTKPNEIMYKSAKAMLRLSPVTDYIKVHYAEEISLKSLSEEFGYTVEHLSRMFQRYAGINYKSYISEIRLDHAIELLDRGDTTISEAAFEVGFSDSRSLAKVFEKRYGMLPSEYLKNQKSDS